MKRSLSPAQKLFAGSAMLLWGLLTCNAPRIQFHTGWSGELTPTTVAVRDKQAVDAFLGGSKEYSSLFLYSNEPDGLFRNGFLSALRAVTEDVTNSGYFDADSVKSIDRLHAVTFENGSIDSRRFVEVDLLPLSAEEMAAFRARLIAAPFVKNFLVNKDFSGAAVIATYTRDPEDRVATHRWQLDLQKEISDRFGLELQILDDVYLNAELDAKALTDTMLWPGLAALTIAVVCFLLCGRRWRHVGGFFLLAGLSVSSLFGVIVLLGYSYSVIFVFIPILLIVTAGSDYPYFALRDHYADPRRLLKSLWVPIVLASVTTAVSSFSLTTSEIDQIRQFGLVAGIGILLTSFYSLSILPAYFAIMDHIAGPPIPSDKNNVIRVDRVSAWLAARSATRLHRCMHGWALAGLTVMAFPLALLLPWTDDVVVDYFDPSHRVVTYAERAGREFGGIDYLKVVLHDPAGFQSPQTLQQLVVFQQSLSRIAYTPVSGVERVCKLSELLSGTPVLSSRWPVWVQNGFQALDQLGPLNPPRMYGEQLIGRQLSIADIIIYINQQWTENPQGVLPEQSQALDYLIANFLGETRQLFQDDLFNADLTQVAVDVFFTSSDTRVTEQVYHKIRQVASEQGLDITVGGYNMKWLTYKQHIVSLKVQSILLVLLLVGLITMAGFAALTRNVWHGLQAGAVVLCVVAVCVIWVLAWMFLTGIKLNIATGTVSAIGVGISVNFAVHLVYAMLKESDITACVATMRSLLTDLATSSCFLFLLGSDIASIRHTGLLITLAVVCAFVFTVLLAPALFPRALYSTLKTTESS